MSDIEATAKPLLSQMIRGSSITLNESEQKTVATWAALKVIVGRYLRQNAFPSERDCLDWYHERHSLPINWMVWLARYDGRIPVFFENHDITDPKTMASDRPQFTDSGIEIFRAHGDLGVIIIGYLAIQVLGVRRGTARFPEHAMLSIWPKTGRNVGWPPPTHFTDDTIERFCGMFLMGVKSGVARALRHSG